MRGFFGNLGDKLQRMMRGRYGMDELSRFLTVFSCMLALLSVLTHLRLPYLLALLGLICSCVRCYSKNIGRRQAERAAFLRLRAKTAGKLSLAKRQFRDRKTHRYFRCASCNAVLRVPKGKGKIEIRCPKCGAVRVEKT